jgi:hypothetical protein
MPDYVARSEISLAERSRALWQSGSAEVSPSDQVAPWGETLSDEGSSGMGWQSSWGMG